MRTRLRLMVTLGAALTALLAASFPVTAREFNGMGFYGVWDHDLERPFHGIVVADRIRGEPRIMLGISEAQTDQQITFTFRSIGCQGNAAARNRILRLRGTTDADGELWLNSTVSSTRLGSVRSVWTNAGAGSCVPVQHHVRVATGDVNGDHVLAHTGDGQILGNLLMIVDYTDQDDLVTLSVVVNGYGGNDAIHLRGVNRACGRNPAQAAFQATLMNAADNGFQQLQVTTSDIDPSVVRSIRVRIGDDVLCAPGIIMANTEGDFH